MIYYDWLRKRMQLRNGTTVYGELLTLLTIQTGAHERANKFKRKWDNAMRQLCARSRLFSSA